MPGDRVGQTLAFGMTDLEEALAGADAESVKRKAVTRLDAARQRVETRLSSGLDPRQVTPTQAIRDAVAAAQGLLASA